MINMIDLYAVYHINLRQLNNFSPAEKKSKQHIKTNAKSRNNHFSKDMEISER